MTVLYIFFQNNGYVSLENCVPECIISAKLLIMTNRDTMKCSQAQVAEGHKVPLIRASTCQATTRHRSS